ncbi:MAG: LamG domain-containing protein [Alteromonadaceae bacterium]
MLSRVISIFLCLTIFALPVYAAECLDIFPTLSQNYGPKLNLPDFKYSSENDGNKTGSNLALTSGQYRDVKVEGGSVYFTELNAEYRFKKIELKDGATAQFVPGDYWVKEFKFKDNSILTVNGSGTVRIYVEKLEIEKNVHINDANGQLIFISYKDIDDVDDALSFTGVMYADEEIKFDKNAIIRGSITAENVNLGNTLSETYQESSITDADFNGMCASAILPIVDYRFDECTYTGSGSEVIDQTGNYNAGINGIYESAVEAQINYSLDLSAPSYEDWLTVPSGVIDGLNDLTLSVWVNVANGHSQQEIFHALGSSTSDDEFEVYLSNESDVYVKVQNVGTILDGSITIANGMWHHILVTRTSDQVCLYVDNQFQDCDTGVGSGQLSVPSSNAIVIGQEQDSFGGLFDSGQSFEGLMDEFKIYDQVLSSTEITSLYTNEFANNNYDGTSRDAVRCNFEPIAKYNLEASTWSGSNSILDSSGSNFHASPVGNISSTLLDPISCQAVDIPNNNNLATRDAIDTGVDVNTLGDQGSIAFWYRSNDEWDGPSSAKVLFDASASSDAQFLMYIWPGGYLEFEASDPYGNRIERYTDQSSIAANTWVHIVVTWNAKSDDIKIYVNGVSNTVTPYLGNTLTQGLNLSLDTLYFGDNNSTTESELGGSADGSIDEINLFSHVLTQTEVNAIYAETPPCETIHHFEINHDAQGLTCIVEPLTIKACVDENCTGTMTTPTDIQIFANGVLKKTVTITGETETSFNHLVAETITLSSDQSYTCKNGSDTNCNISFANAGFLLDVNTGADVPSCESVDFEIKAVKLSDSGVSCAPAFTGSQDLNFIFSYSNPTSGTKSPLINNANMATSGQSQTRSIIFDATGKATLPVEYADAGILTFTLSENVSSGVSSATINKDFIPAKIVLTAYKLDNTLLNNVTPDVNPKQVAADSFKFNYSGQCNDNTETSNYIPQSSSAIALAVRHVLPSSITSILGDLTVEGTIINATDSANTDWQPINTMEKELVASYNEVGVISINIKDTDYLGNEINTLDFIDVGRFYPSYFDVSITHNSFENTGTTGATDFTYIGQPFGYSYAPILTITAKNALGVKTQNYTETSFQKLTAANITRTFPLADTVVNGIDNATKMVVEATTSTGDLSKLSNGVMDYSFSASDTFTYIKDSNSEVSEFTVSYDILINSITDSDSVGINVDTTLPLTLQPTGGFQRFGRLVLENSFGSETSALIQSFEVEFLNTSGDFQRNSDDDFSIITNVGSNWSFTNPTNGITISDLLISGNVGSFTGGQFRNIDLLSGDNQGAIDIEFTTPTWLQYNWSGKVSNVHDENTNATATFGVYRGNDRIISWREVGN